MFFGLWKEYKLHVDKETTKTMDQDNVFNLKSVVYFVLIFKKKDFFLNKNRLRDRPRKNKYGNYLLLHKLCLFVKKK